MVEREEVMSTKKDFETAIEALADQMAQLAMACTVDPMRSPKQVYKKVHREFIDQYRERSERMLQGYRVLMEEMRKEYAPETIKKDEDDEDDYSVPEEYDEQTTDKEKYRLEP